MSRREQLSNRPMAERMKVGPQGPGGLWGGLVSERSVVIEKLADLLGQSNGRERASHSKR